MNVARKTYWLRRLHAVACISGMLLVMLGTVSGAACAQQPAAETASPAKADGQVVGDTAVAGLPASAGDTPAERERAAWEVLANAMGDVKHPQTRIQALAALGLLRAPRSEKVIADAMNDADMDVRTAAVLAAGQSKDRNLSTNIRNLLDDKEPQVAFTAAMTLWKMGDKSGEDILTAVVDGGRSATAGMMHGTEHRLSKDLHDPVMLARLGALQGAAMMLGPFGFGITAFEYMHQNGGDLARVSAIEQISQEQTDPIHRELVAALGDKDQAVRAAAAKALVEYEDKATSMAVYALLTDPKQPVRLTAAAVYLRTTGTPGPEAEKPVVDAATPRKRKRLNAPTSMKPVAPVR
ncbi:MAG TPA: HEAT repeat domain-containing protein [Acidobacteriaceae bacterium]|nr:HEAT repeat domain-containing protein [Acidobacteriaceae bacterium]